MNAPFDAKANVGKYDLIKQYKDGKISKGNFFNGTRGYRF